MNKFFRNVIFPAVVLLVLIVALLLFFLRDKKIIIESYDVIERPARICPDYCDTVIPPNITALNFAVQEEGDCYYVKIYSSEGEPIEVCSKSGKIVIPLKSWRRLLGRNKGNRLYFEIFVKNRDGCWNKFNPVSNKIVREEIDNFVIYRKMHPTHVHYNGNIGIYQRDLSSFEEKLILDKNFVGEWGCLNCHTPCKNDASRMLVGVRSRDYGVSTLFIQDEKTDKIGAKFGYSCWHPSGKLAVYSVDRLPMFFHSARSVVRDTVDVDSYIACYYVESAVIKTIPSLSRKEKLETWPVWSADGKYLYYCSAPMLWSQTDKIPPDEYKDVRYSLFRISYDIAQDKWGREETIVSSDDTGLSVAMPKTSPDGRWLSFCMFGYGFFPTWQRDSDIFLIDLESGETTGQYTPVQSEINSDRSESWHSWSSNSRWIVFSSKRDYGVFTRLYISYIDKEGNAYKPFVLPQKDPGFYGSCLLTYNTPELVNEPVPFRGENLARVIRGSGKISPDMPVTMATPKTEGASESDWHRQRE